MTIHAQPKDSLEGPVLWVKIAILFFIGVVLPLVMPREYVPFDPNVGISLQSTTGSTYITLVESDGTKSRADGVLSVGGDIFIPGSPHYLSPSCSSFRI